MTNKVLFDNYHGQDNWKQTGLQSRCIDASFSGLSDIIKKLGFVCTSERNPLHSNALSNSRALIIPSPTGIFNPDTHCWEWDEKSFFSGKEIEDIRSFVYSGGSLLAFSYRFGDPFTKTNLGQLFSSLGCILNYDMIISLKQSNKLHPLHTTFITKPVCVQQPWALEGVEHIQWRPVSSFTILPNCNAHPVVTSPKECIRLEWPGKRVFHQSAPICVCGILGRGRYILAGGPNVFESSGFGLLDKYSNLRFVSNLIQWLLIDDAPIATDVKADIRISELKSRSYITCERATGRTLLMDEALRPGTQFNLIKSSLTTEGRMRSSIKKSLWLSVCASQNKKDREGHFVQFVVELLEDTGIFKPLFKQKWSLKRDSEIDLVYECLSDKLIWNESGGILPIECKNWKKPVPSEEISRFADKVSNIRSNIGIFAARSFTGASWETAKNIRLKSGVIIGFLYDDDFNQYINNSASALSLVESSIIRCRLL